MNNVRKMWWLVGLILVVLVMACEGGGDGDGDEPEWRVPSQHPTPSQVRVDKTPGHVTQAPVRG